MPKEAINPHADGYVVKVGWQNGGSMQVGVEAKGETLLRQLYGDEDTLGRIGDAAASLLGELPTPAAGGIALGSRVLDLIDNHRAPLVLPEQHEHVPPPTGEGVSYAVPGFRGVWSYLDRQGVNYLIRTLRRARDATFGRDE